MQVVGVDTTIQPFQEVRIHPLDIGLHRGYGVFDYFPLRTGKPLFFRDYMRRFRQSALAMGIPLLYSDAQLSHHLQELVEREGVDFGGCKLLLTGGGSEDGYTPQKPTLYTFAFAKTPPNAPLGGPPARINLLEHQRPIPSVKTTNYSAALRQQARQLTTGAAELVYHFGGYVTEASRSNLFCINQQGHMIVPPMDDVLKGITIKHLIAAARKAGHTILERSLPLQELLSASEVGITSSTRMVQAVGQIEDTPVGDGKIGAHIAELANLFAKHADQHVGWL